MKDRFSNELEKQLKLAGWFPGRQTDLVIAQLEFSLHSAGESFLREFGGLAIGRIILTDATYVNACYKNRILLASVDLPNCLPIGASWYWCEGELWMDELGRVYQVGDGEMAMVSEKIEDALEILVIRKTPIPTNLPKWKVAPRPQNPHDLGVVYDKAKYHMTGARGDAPSWEHASGSALFMLRWLIDQQLISSHFMEESSPLLEEYRNGSVSLFKLYEENWDMVFSSEMLTDEGNAFARAYFDYDCGQYTKDLWTALNLSKQDYPLYNEEAYGRFKPLLDTRYAEWKAGNLKTLPYKQPKEWPKWKIYLVGLLLAVIIFVVSSLIGRLIEAAL